MKPSTCNFLSKSISSSSPRFMRFNKRHPNKSQTLLQIAAANVKQGRLENKSLSDIVSQTRREVTGSILTSIALGLLVKIAVEWIYRFLEEHRLLPFDND